MSNVLVSPKNTLIKGTLETIPGCALINNPRAAGHGFTNGDRFDFDWSGDTECYWDDQTTDMHEGERLFVDENGDNFKESDLRLMSEEDFKTLSEDTQPTI